MTEIEFLNIDLDIESIEDLSPIIQEWTGKLCLLRYDEYNGIYYASFETGFGQIEDIVCEYVSLIDGLSPQAKAIWDKAIRRDFDFGYESGTCPNNFRSHIKSDSVKELARVGGSIIVTIYPFFHENE